VDLSFSVEGPATPENTGLLARSQVFPLGSYGGTVGSGGWASRTMILSADSVGEDEWLIPSQTLIGGHNLLLPLNAVSPINAYPFDSYQTSWTGFVKDAVSGERIPVVQTAETGSTPGFDVSIQRAGRDGDVQGPAWINPKGRFAFEVTVARNPSVRFQVGLLSLTMLAGGGAALLMTALILSRRRPPSLNALGWLATFLFALLEVRSNFPGDPPLGTRLDSVVTFPLIFLVVLLIVLIATSWLRRDDWDMENLPRAYP